MRRLEGKVALITGAGGGIARAAALIFAREGARVALAEIQSDAGRETEKRVREADGEGFFIETDVREEESVRRAVEQVIERYGRLDVLYNCAGGSRTEDDLVTEVDLSVWQHTMASTLR